MSDKSKRTMAYIVNMPQGFDPWTYREIDILRGEGFDIAVFPLNYNDGPYMPEDDWDRFIFNRWLAVLQQPWFLLTQPVRYFRLLAEAIRTRSLVDFLLAFVFARQMARRKVAMIHCVFGAHQLFIGYYCKRILDIPLSVALYGYDLRANPNWTLFEVAVQAADAVVVNCEFNRELLAKRAGEEVARRAVVIRHYAETPPAAEAETVKVLIVGRFEERKGHDLLFQAVRDLRAAAQHVEIWVAGFAGAVDMAQLARDTGIADRVRIFVRASDEVLQLLFRECDIFCLPSRTDAQGVSEGLPVSLIEAMGQGKPVISTRLAGIPELVEDILIEENDLSALTETLGRLIADPALRRKLGARNRQIVQAQYARQNVLATRDLFLQAIDD